MKLRKKIKKRIKKRKIEIKRIRTKLNIKTKRNKMMKCEIKKQQVKKKD
jgi:hypothetical protein